MKLHTYFLFRSVVAFNEHVSHPHPSYWHRRYSEAVARISNGFTGAELANVVNEGVLLAARDDREVVTVDDLFQGAERTKNGVGVGQGAAGVLSGLRKLMSGSDGSGRSGGANGGGDGPSSSGGFGSGGGGPEGIREGNKRQGVGLSMPPT